LLANIKRPHSLSEVIGQDTIVKAIYNSFKTNSLSNVIYLLGNSGTGKNTIANIVALMLMCENPDENHNPCGKCSHCLDIIEEKNNTIKIYSGADLTADALKELETELQYSPSIFNRNRVYIFNEAQQSSVLRRLLEVIETVYTNTYFIITSTDKSKFSNLSGKSNKEQETQALRSRGTYFNLKNISTKQIGDYLFSLLEKFDPEGKLPETFIEEGLLTIAENANGNLRLAINDFSTVLNAETFTQKEIIDLLGYQNTTNYLDYLSRLCKKDKTVLQEIKELDDAYSFFVYTWKVLMEIQVRHILGNPFDEEWKEKNYKQMITLPYFKELYSSYSKIGLEIGGTYYNGNFINILLCYLILFFEGNKIFPNMYEKKLPRKTPITKS
jgi:DNA polymerase III gamma/tau subunit